ncbi:MAG: hypothetical protein GC131_02925 [Alphaproteobacteria bacterium]|nr:hypothetical protein [Alphaproteobacteria bacterium]
MAYEYSAENHNWDLTLRASWNLLMSGQAASKGPNLEKKNEQVFSFFTGSMLLAFCAIENFTSSVAFSMPDHDRFRAFDYEGYKRIIRFWDKIEKVCAALNQPVDKSQGLFQIIKEMQIWRNALSHTSSYEIESTEIQDTVKDSSMLHVPFHNKEYARSVNVGNAKKFYCAAYNYIDMVKNASGIEPRASCTYKPI